MPLGAFFGVLFFILLGIAALTSAISLLEVVTAWLMDEKDWSEEKPLLSWVWSFLSWGCQATLGYSVLKDFSFPGLNKDLLDTYDWVSNSIFLPVGGFMMAVFTGYVWGAKHAIAEVNKGHKRFMIGL